MNNVLCMRLKHNGSLFVVLRGRVVASDGSLKLMEATWPLNEVGSPYVKNTILRYNM